MRAPGPPALARWILARSLTPDDRDEVVGDLEEEFRERVLPRRGARAARRWYWGQVIRSLPHNLARRGSEVRRRNTRNGGEGVMRSLLQDVRYGLRTLRRDPGFAVMVILTLALGIGANAVIFSLVDGVILNPFPYPRSETLVGVGPVYPKLGRELAFWEVLSPPEYRDIKEGSRTLERVVAWDMGHRQIAGETETRNVFSAFWWGNAFRTLEVEPHLGRGLTPEETLRGDPVVVLGHRLWTQTFGADSSLVGSTIHVNGNPYTVVGIMPRGTSIYGTELWMPMGIAPGAFSRGRRQMQLLARTAPGATLSEVNAELETIARRIEAEHGREFEEYEGWGLRAMTWTGINVRNLRPMALVLAGAVGFVLLLVCANVASLLLARATRRRREMAVRTALGAGRMRLFRQVLTESVALSLVGGVLGVGVAFLGIRGVERALTASPLPLPGDPSLSPRVLLFTAGVAVLAGLLFGLAPAFQSVGKGVRDVLQGEGRGATAGRARQRVQRSLVAVEVALALVLLLSGSLLVHSFIKLQRVDLGIDTENVLTMRLTLPWEDYQGPGIHLFFDELVDRVEGLPGVRTAGVASQFAPVAFLRRQVRFEGQEVASESSLPVAYTTIVDDGYFETAGIRLLRGRLPGQRDGPDSRLVVVVNEAFARRLVEGDPLGRRFRTGTEPDAPVFEIVGVVSSARNQGPARPPQPEAFIHLRQASGWSNQLFLLAKTEVEPYSLLPAIKDEVSAMDPDQPVYAVATLEERVAGTRVTEKVATLSLLVFAAFALLLAAVGIYAVVAYAVEARVQEIGIRVALGAGRRKVRWLVVRQNLVPVVVGATLGLAGSVAVGGLMGEILFRVSPTDPLALAAGSALLVLVALAASWIPARRASRLDPVQSLRAGTRRGGAGS